MPVVHEVIGDAALISSTGVQGGLPSGTHTLNVAYGNGASTTVTITVAN